MPDAVQAAASDAAAVAAAAPAAAAAKPWYEGKADAEIIGHWQNKNWKSDDPGSLAIEATKAARSAEKLIGAPPEEILRMPKASAQPAEIDAFWQRLGAPKETKDVDLSTIKDAAGKPIDEKLADVLRNASVAGRVPKDAAGAVARAVVKHLDDIKAESDAILSGRIAEEKNALDRSWGTNKPANMVAAERALTNLAKAVGQTPEQAKLAWDNIAKMGGIGAAATMNMLLQIDKRMGEGAYVDLGSNRAGDLPMTREAAIAEIALLKKDAEFGKKYFNKDVMAVQRMNALHKIAYGQQSAA